MTNSMRTKTSALKLFSVLAASLATFSGPAFAYKVAPMVVELRPSGSDAKTTMTITNTHDYPLTLEFVPIERTLDAAGEEAEIPADDSFLIFPPQAIVPPGKSQRLQVRYVGDALQSSKAYRINIIQVPVKQKADDPSVNFSLKFKTAVYVVPKGANFDVKASDIARSAESYSVTLTNTGDRHAVLTTGKWTGVSASGESAPLDPLQFGLKEFPLIQANSSRTISIPLSALNGLPDLTSIEVAPER